MSNREDKAPPPYAIHSVDNALRLAAILQLESGLTVSSAAQRLGVANSTAHRLLAMLVYRDFAVRDEQKVYRAGPVLELATHSGSAVSRLRQAAIPHMQALVSTINETVSLTIRTGTTVRFIASVECTQTLRVGSRDGMVFSAHNTTAGLLLLADLSVQEVVALYTEVRADPELGSPIDINNLLAELEATRSKGFAVNRGRSERGVVAVGVAVRSQDGEALAGLSASVPTVRYSPNQLPELVGPLRIAASSIRADLTLLDWGGPSQ